MFGRAGGADERVRPGQLEVAAGGCVVERPERMVGQDLERGVLICRIAINEDSRDRLGHEVLDDADVGFAVDVLEDQWEITAGGGRRGAGGGPPAGARES